MVKNVVKKHQNKNKIGLVSLVNYSLFLKSAFKKNALFYYKVFATLLIALIVSSKSLYESASVINQVSKALGAI